MRVKKGFVLREVSGQHVVIATGDASQHFRGMVKLNATSKSIWEGVAKGLTVSEIVSEYMSTFEVDEITAAEDVNSIIEKMRKAGFIEE